MSYDPFPPNGFDWADGEDIRPGTPTSPSAVLSSPIDIATLGMLEEYPNSPEIERGEQATFRHSFKCDWETGKIIISALGRGTWVQDSNGFIYRILTTQLNREKGNLATLITTAEAISFDNPPDEFDVEDIELNPEIEKHPAYVAIHGDGMFTNPYNLDSTGTAISASQLTGPRIIEICKQAAAASSILGSNDVLSQLNSTNIASDWPIYNNAGVQVFTATAASILALARSNLYLRYLRDETTFYMAGFKVTWSSYYFVPPLMDGAGYIQDPVYEGNLPPYFWSTTQEPDGQNIFLELSLITNPTIYLGGISWLRTADRLNYSRTWFKLTRTWLGGPLGQWDKTIYPAFTT